MHSPSHTCWAPRRNSLPPSDSHTPVKACFSLFSPKIKWISNLKKWLLNWIGSFWKHCIQSIHPQSSCFRSFSSYPTLCTTIALAFNEQVAALTREISRFKEEPEARRKVNDSLHLHLRRRWVGGISQTFLSFPETYNTEFLILDSEIHEGNLIQETADVVVRREQYCLLDKPTLGK